MSEQTPSQEVPTAVECPAAKDPAVRMFILAAMLIGFGIWCFVEAYVFKKYTKGGDTNAMINYYFNHIGGIALPVGGLIPLWLGIAALRRRLVADQEGVGYVGKEKIPWSAARALDTSKLADKGILYLKYDTGGGEGTMVLDSWRLQNFRPLALLLEAKVLKRSG